MASATRTTKAGTIERRINLGEAVKGILTASVVEITNGKKIDFTMYFLQRQASDFGTAFTVEKYEEGETETYDVCLNVPGAGHSCDCAWGSYGAHKKACRHIELALQALRERKL